MGGSTVEEAMENTNVTYCGYFAQRLRCIKSKIEVSLDHSGNTLLIHVIDFLQLRKEKRAWHGPPFSINRVRVHLAVYPSGHMCQCLSYLWKLWRRTRTRTWNTMCQLLPKDSTDQRFPKN